MFQTRANYGVSNAQEDVLLNPYVPPLRNDLPSQDLRGPVMPINISTSSCHNTSKLGSKALEVLQHVERSVPYCLHAPSHKPIVVPLGTSISAQECKGVPS